MDQLCAAFIALFDSAEVRCHTCTTVFMAWRLMCPNFLWIQGSTAKGRSWRHLLSCPLASVLFSLYIVAIMKVYILVYCHNRVVHTYIVVYAKSCLQKCMPLCNCIRQWSHVLICPQVPWALKKSLL